LDRFGFPRGFLTRQKQVHGFQTGDRVIAKVSKGKKIGHYTGRVAVRTSGNFNIQTADGVVQGVNWKNCSLVQRSDGYHYPSNSKKITTQEQRFLPVLKDRVSRCQQDESSFVGFNELDIGTSRWK
jgi:hypothetical protein